MPRYAYFVGVNSYRDPGIRPLKYAERDARELSAIFGRTLGYDAEYLEERIGEQIEDRIEQLERRLKPGDTFLFYFAGHGKEHGGDQLFLLPAVKRAALDGGATVTGGVLSFNALCRITESPAWNGVHRVFVFDACRSPLDSTRDDAEARFSGEAILRGVGPGRPNGARQKADYPLTVINACSEGQSAAELPNANERGNGALTAVLIEALEGGLRQIDERTGKLLGQRMEAKTLACGLGQHRQQPMIAGKLPVVLGDAQTIAASAPEIVVDKARGLDERLWKLACLRHTVAAYEDHLSDERFECVHADEALERIRALETKMPVPEAATPEMEFPAPEVPKVTPVRAKKRTGEIKAPAVSVDPGLDLNSLSAWPFPVGVAPSQPAVAKSSTMAAREAGETFRDGPDFPEMVVIPPGSFMMGSPESGAVSFLDERPQHKVTIATSFALAKYPVTQGQWKALMGNSPSRFKSGWFSNRDDCPVERVNWDDAQAYAKRLSEQTGQKYRLPSEAEWEYSCRAGGQYAYCGGEEIGKVAWYFWNSGLKTHPVGQKQANAWGLYDMSGNVWEWVEDVWHDDYTGAPEDGSTWLTGGGQDRRVLRGGSWNAFPHFARAAYRIGSGATVRDDLTGFRVVRMLP